MAAWAVDQEFVGMVGFSGRLGMALATSTPTFGSLWLPWELDRIPSGCLLGLFDCLWPPVESLQSVFWNW